ALEHRRGCLRRIMPYHKAARLALDSGERCQGLRAALLPRRQGAMVSHWGTPSVRSIRSVRVGLVMDAKLEIGPARSDQACPIIRWIASFQHFLEHRVRVGLTA